MTRIFKYLFASLFSLTSSSLSAHQSDIYQDVIIEGTLSEKLIENLKKDPNVFYYSEHIPGYSQNATKIPIEIQENKFKVRIPMHESIGYLGLGNSVVRTIFANLILVEAGDSLSINSRNQWETKFSGKGSERATVQVQYPQTLLPINYNNHLKYSDYLEVLLDSLKTKKEIALATIQNLPNTSTLAKKIMLYNIYGCIDINYLEIINSLNQYEKMNKAFVDLNSHLKHLNANDDEAVNMSFMLILAHYSAIRAIAYHDNKDIDAIGLNVLECINKNYDHVVKDRLLAIAFIRMGKRSDLLLSLLPKNTTTIKDKLSNAILKEIAETKLPGRPAFKFSFTGLKGNRISLEHFKGKTIILDTWFNGCLACLKLAELMEPIAKHFYQNQNVVFLSINAVDGFTRFASGVSEGKYGSSQTIYGYTAGLGLTHPMIKHYQYTSFPNLLIIGKDGNIISSNPPWPVNASKAKEFIKLIEDKL
ncbi:MAG: TlpA family protein disulfide reductase [Flavobacterium sp.]|nr:MAG: TlpA family protein disulfide reductase [Flavobacterium sp.]